MMPETDSTLPDVPHPTADAPRISIVVPCLDEAARLGQTLDSLLSQTRDRGQYEVIVVDGGSVDSTREIAQSRGVRVVDSARGHGRQRNAGAAQAGAPWVCFLDADCSVAADWLERAMTAIAPGNVHMIGGAILAPEDGCWIERAWGVHLEMRRRKASATSSDLFRLMSATNLFVNRDAFLKAGGFDETVSSGEDTLLGFAFSNTGRVLRYEPDLAVIHRGEPKTLADFFRQQLWHSNTDVWRKIGSGSKRGAGQRARRYGLLQILMLAMLLAGAGSAVVLTQPLLALLAAAIYISPPLLLSLRASHTAGDYRQVIHLAVLYWVYGVARAAYILGLARVTVKEKRF